MTAEQKEDVKAAIRYYERRGWDWSSVVGFLCAKYDGYLERIIHPWPVRTYGRSPKGKEAVQ